jgi:hypothetical protein
MFGNAKEVAIGSEQRKSVLDTGSGDQAVNRANLDSLGTAMLSELRRGDVRLPFKWKKWERIEQTMEPIKIILASQAIEQFLQDITGQE